jgi:hypothetical protein
MIKIKLVDVKKAFQDLKLQVDSEVEKQSSVINKKLLAELKEETPVDTGNARDSWEIRKINSVTEIRNTTDYIQYLNQGSSKQAPRYFVERTALKYGSPIGTIVEVQIINDA